MEQQELLQQIEQYKQADGSYDVRRLEKDLGIESSLERTFALMMNGNGGVLEDDDPRLKLAVEINGRLYDEKKAADIEAVREALSRFMAGTATFKEMRLLERANLVIAEYRDPDSERPTGFRLKATNDIDGNIYSDQAGLEEHPGRL